MPQAPKLGIKSYLPDEPAGPRKPLGISTYIPDEDPDAWALPKLPTITRGATVDVPKPSLLERFSDLTLTGVKGAISVPESAVGALDLAARVPAPWNNFGMAPRGTLGGLLRDTVGFDPAAAKYELDQLYSPAQKEAQQRLAESEGFGETVRTIASNPSLAVHGTVESLPGMLAGGAVGRTLGGLMAIAPEVGGAIGEGVVAGASNVADVIQRREAEGKEADAKDLALAAADGILTTGISRVSAGLAKRFGFADVDTMMAEAAHNSAFSTTVREYLGNTIKSMATEAGLEELPQSAVDRITQNLQDGKPWMEGVPREAATGAVLGGVMAGGGSTVDFAGGVVDRARAHRATSVPRPPIDPTTTGVPASGEALDIVQQIEDHVGAVSAGVAPRDLPLNTIRPAGVVPNLPLQPIGADTVLELTRRGFSSEDIANMVPEEARAILQEDMQSGSAPPPIPTSLGPDAYAGPERRQAAGVGPAGVDRRADAPIDTTNPVAAAQQMLEENPGIIQQAADLGDRARGTRTEAPPRAEVPGTVPVVPSGSGAVEVAPAGAIGNQPEPSGTVPEPARPPVPTYDERDTTKYTRASIPGLFVGREVTHGPTGHTGVVLDWYQGPDQSTKSAYKVRWDTGETTIVNQTIDLQFGPEREGFDATEKGNQPENRVPEHPRDAEGGAPAGPVGGRSDAPEAPVSGREQEKEPVIPPPNTMERGRYDFEQRQRAYVERHGQTDLSTLDYHTLRKMEGEQHEVSGPGNYALEGEARQLHNRIHHEVFAREQKAQSADRARRDALDDPDRAAYGAFHSFAGSAIRWAERRAAGMSDADLKAAISDEFGISGGATSRGEWSQDHKGGQNPELKVYNGYGEGREERVYKGKKLIELARRVLDIPSTDESGQEAEPALGPGDNRVETPAKPYSEMTRDEKIAAIAARVAKEKGEAPPKPKAPKKAKAKKAKAQAPPPGVTVDQMTEGELMSRAVNGTPEEREAAKAELARRDTEKTPKPERTDDKVADDAGAAYEYLLNEKEGKRSGDDLEDRAVDSGLIPDDFGATWGDDEEYSLLHALSLQAAIHPSVLEAMPLARLRAHVESAEDLLARADDLDWLDPAKQDSLEGFRDQADRVILRREGQQAIDFDLRVDPPVDVPKPPKRTKLEQEQDELDARRAAAKAKREAALKKLNQNLGYQANMGIDPENIGLVVDILDSYIEEGIVSFKEIVLEFRKQYGRRDDLDPFFETAWELHSGESVKVADIKDDTQEPTTASATLYQALRTGDLPTDNKAVKAVITRVIPGADPNSNEMLNAATDAIEAVLASRLESLHDNSVAGPPYEQARTLEKQLTRAYRTPEKQRLQQFSTPLPIAVAVARAARVSRSDQILEPTAGTGNLIAPLRGYRVRAQEIDPSRSALLKAQGWVDVVTADYLRAPLDKNAWSVIVTNPPWGKYSTGKYGQAIEGDFKPGDVAERFVAKNIKELKPGGRLVAVMPTTMLGAGGVNFRGYLDKHGTIRAIIKSPPNAYDTRGTNVESLLLVFDKAKNVEGARVESLNTADWAAYQAAVERIGPRVQVETQPAPAPNPEGPRPAARPGARGAGGRPGKAPAGPRNAPSAKPDNGAPPVAPPLPPGDRGKVEEPRGGPPVARGEVSDDPTRGLSESQLVAYRAAERSERFAPYQLRTALHGVRHPRLMVEARGLAGVEYPALDYVPSALFEQIIADGRASIEQAEQALAAVQANTQTNGHGYLAADNVGVGKAREAWFTVIELMERAKTQGHPMRLVLTTKNADNIANLLNGELPALLGDQPPGFEIIQVADYKQSRRTAGNQEQPLAPLPKPMHGVYLVDSYNIAPFREALVEANVNGIVGDEAHRFKNAEAQVGAAWQQLHADVFARVPREQQAFAYFTATPAQQVEDYQYLYGLRLWPIDGFNDWVDMVTGQATEEEAGRIREAAEAGGYDIQAIAGNTGDDVVGADSTDVATTARPGNARGGGDAFTSRLTPAEGEQITREWKRLGRFSSRDLWREGTEFVIEEATQSAEEIERYDQFAELCRDVLAAATKFGRANKVARSSIGGVKSQLQFAAKRVQMQPSLVKAVELAKGHIASGHQVVLSMINVSEFDAEAGNIAAAVRQINIHDMSLVDDGEIINNGEIPEAVVARAELMEKAAALGKLPSPVDYITEHLGADNVAFIIGGNVRNRESHAREFQDGARKVAVISAAGSTGISLDHRVKTGTGAEGRRVFIDVQFDWSATEAIQRYGRVDRASQISPPKITPISFGTAAEKKFLATIANRMSSLGALSKGGSQTTGAAELEEFEINGPESNAAAREAWNALPDETKMLFMGRKFRDVQNLPGGQVLEHPAKRTNADIGDIMLALLFVPTSDAATYWESFIAERDRLRAMQVEGAQRRTNAGKGEILRSLVLTPELTLHQVKDENNRKFGILSGVVMPEMPRIRDFLRDLNNEVRRHYASFTSGSTTVAGLEIPWSRISGLARFYGRVLKAEVLDTPEKVMEALRAGEAVDLQQQTDKGVPWRLRLRRDGKVAVDGVKMADRNLVTKHGAGYNAAGNWWEATDLPKFLARFPAAKPTVAATSAELEGDEGARGGGGESSGTASSEGGFSERAPREGTLPGGNRARPIEFPELVHIARALIGDVDAIARLRKAETRGQFRHAGRLASIRIAADLFKPGNEIQLARTIAHEIGHATDWLPHKHLKRGNLLGRLFSLQGFLKHTFGETKLADVRLELQAFSAKWRPWERSKADKREIAYRDSSRELYADAISGLLTNPGLLEETAPTFYKRFFESLDEKPAVRDAYFGIQELLSGTREELIERRLANHRAMFERGDMKALDLQRQMIDAHDRESKDLWLRFKTNLIDRNTAIIDKVKQLEARGVKVNPDEDPRYFLEERNYIGGKIKGWLDRTVTPLYQALGKAGVGWDDFGLALMFERVIAGDREALANPQGVNTSTAQEEYDRLLSGLTADQRRVLARSITQFRDAFREVTDAAADSGLYSDSQIEGMDENKAYATFQVIDYIEKGMTSSIIRQSGTLRDIVNPADATVLKALVTIRATEHNNIKRATFDLLTQHFPNEIRQAREVHTGKRREVMEPERGERDKWQLITYKEDGRVRGKYVDPYVAASLRNETVGKSGAIISALRLMNSKVFRPLFTTYNPGFMTFNIARDFLRFWKNLPTMSLKRAIERYAEAVPMARVRAFGLPKNPTPAQVTAWKQMIAAEESKIFSVTFNDMAKGRETEDAQIEDIFVRSGIGDVRHTPALIRKLEAGLEKAGPVGRVLRPVMVPELKGLFAVLNTIEKVGNFIETLPKAAAIHEFRGNGPVSALTPAQRSIIRREVGSPDFLAGGSWKPIFNEIFLFSNAITQAMRADVRVATQPRTRAGWWMKTAAMNILPKAVALAFLAGLGPGSDEDKERRKRLWRNISEYDFTNYLAFPIGEDERGRSVYLRIPQDDAGRLIGGIFWKAMRLVKPGDTDALTSLMQLFDYTSGQAPGLTPTLAAAGNAIDFLSGVNVFDRFRGRPIFTDDEFKARDTRMIRKYLGWQFQQVGGNVIWKFNPGEILPREQTGTQKVLDFPVVSNVVGRWVKVSNYGEVEAIRGIKDAVQRDEARLRLDQREEVNAAVRRWQSLQPWERTVEWRRKTATEIVGKVYADASKLERAEKAHRLEKTLKMAFKRGEADPYVDQLLSATSNEQKVAILKAAREAKGEDAYEEWFAELRKEKLISDPLRKLVR